MNDIEKHKREFNHLLPEKNKEQIKKISDALRDGGNGGYYTPSVVQSDESTIRLSFIPSKDTMPPVADVDITIPNKEGGVTYEAGENILIKNNRISVLTADEAEQDNTRPITSAAVHTQLGNIQALLETI